MNLDFKGVLMTTLDRIRTNPLVFAPQVIWTLVYVLMIVVLIGGAVVGFGATGGDNGGALALGFFGALFVFFIVMLVVSIFTYGWTSGMAAELADEGYTGLGSGLSRFTSNLGSVIVVFVVLGICGLFTACLIGIVGLFFFMFALPAVLIGGLGGVDSLKESFEVVKNNIVDALAVVGVGIVLGIASYIVSLILSLILSIIPVIGSIFAALISGLLSAAVGTFIIVLVFEVYKELTGGPEVAAEGPPAMMA